MLVKQVAEVYTGYDGVIMHMIVAFGVCQPIMLRMLKLCHSSIVSVCK
jgi:hypothetical protein